MNGMNGGFQVNYKKKLIGKNEKQFNFFKKKLFFLKKGGRSHAGTMYNDGSNQGAYSMFCLFLF